MQLDIAKENFLRDPLIGKVIVQLRPDVAPITVKNFVDLVAGHKYDNTPFHRVVKDFMVQGGDIVNADGTGSYTAAGGEGDAFDDEAFVLKHDMVGSISMANSGPNTNGSQFFITTRPAPHLDGSHVVFGRVVRGMEHVHDIENEVVDHNHRPIRRCYIQSASLWHAEHEAEAKDMLHALEEEEEGAAPPRLAAPPGMHVAHAELSLSSSSPSASSSSSPSSSPSSSQSASPSMGTPLMKTTRAN